MKTKLLILGGIILLGVILYIKIPSNTIIDYKHEELINTIDSLNLELSKVKLQRDSLYNLLDSSDTKITEITKWYEKELIDITNQPIADDVEFFSNYISENNP